MFLPNARMIAKWIIMIADMEKIEGYFISMFPNIPKYFWYQPYNMVS